MPTLSNLIYTNYPSVQPNQLAHPCVTYTIDDIISLHFDEALQSVNHSETEEVWQDFIRESSVPSPIVQDVLEDDNLFSEDYIKEHIAGQIERFVRKIF